MMSLPILPIRRVFQRGEIIFPRQPRSPAKPKGARRLWAIENRLQWIPDSTFRDDQSRLRTAHGAKKNGPPSWYAARNPMRTVKKQNEQSMALRRGCAGWDSAEPAKLPMIPMLGRTA